MRSKWTDDNTDFSWKGKTAFSNDYIFRQETCVHKQRNTLCCRKLLTVVPFIQFKYQSEIYINISTRDWLFSNHIYVFYFFPSVWLWNKNCININNLIHFVSFISYKAKMFCDSINKDFVSDVLLGYLLLNKKIIALIQII